MTHEGLLINGTWRDGNGPVFSSTDPATGDAIWEGASANEKDVDAAVRSARAAFPGWERTSLEERVALLERFSALLNEHQQHMAEAISRDSGKPLWDAMGEAGAMARKVGISLQAYRERTGTREATNGAVRTRLTHRPHGVLAVFGPYNFPGHLPNGHIVPALLAGNTVVFKPSEQTPLVGQKTLQLWQEAGLPDGVINLVQGARETGVALSTHNDIDGVLFTGSVPTGQALHRQLAGHPEKILALELGGNNPFIVFDVADLESAAIVTIQSAFITSGQRCTCARRLIVPDGAKGDAILDRLTAMMDRIKVGAWNAPEEPFMGPVVSVSAAKRAMASVDALIKAGARAIRPMAHIGPTEAFLSPGLIDVTAVNSRPDEEIFGPVLQVVRVPDFDAAMAEANNTRFGLAAGLLSDNRDLYDRFYQGARAGIVNWNRPLTGAASDAPFGGIGLSGNHRPAAYYAADYCAWPVASIEASSDRLGDEALPKGIAP